MSAGRKTDVDKENDGFPSGETSGDDETFGEALSKAGFEPTKAGRKMVSQGKRRETLKKRVRKDQRD